MQDINLYQLLKFYAKKWAWILLITVLGVVAGYVYNTYLQTPLYKSNATLLLVSSDGKTTSQDVTLINNYMQLFKSRRVLEPVIQEQNLDIDYDTLVKSIEATNEKNTEVIKVAISTPNAEISRKLVEGSIASFRKEAQALYDLDNIKLIDEASYPERPYNISKLSVLTITGLSGFGVAMLGLFFAYDYSLTHKPKKKVKNKAVKKKSKASPNRKFMGIFSKKSPPLAEPIKKKQPAKKTTTKPKTAASATNKIKKSTVKKTTNSQKNG